MRLHREVAIPDGLREARLFVRLVQVAADTLLLQAARGPSDATHQIIDAAGRPLITALSEHDREVAWTLMTQNVWKFLKSLTLLGVARPGMTFVDVGAQAGHDAVLLASILQPAGQIHAFESDPNNALVLTANALLTCQIDPLASRITAWELALSDQPGPGPENVVPTTVGRQGLVDAVPDQFRHLPVTTTLDALRFPGGGQRPLIDRRVDLLKAEGRGSKGTILCGGRRLLREDRPVVCLAFPRPSDGSGSDCELVRGLEDAGYRAFRLFPAASRDPYQSLVEFGAIYTADDLVRRLQREGVGPDSTLFAYPTTVACGPGAS
jgi:hypothetical protein